MTEQHITNLRYYTIFVFKMLGGQNIMLIF